MKKVTELRGVYFATDGDCLVLATEIHPEKISSTHTLYFGEGEKSSPDNWFPEHEEGKKYNIRITVEIEEV